MVFQKKIVKTEEEEDEDDEDEEEEPEEATKELREGPKETKPIKGEVSLVVTVKEQGLGLQMPDGNVLNLNEVQPGMAAWMSWVTKTLQDIKKNIAG